MKTLFPKQLKPEARAWYHADAAGKVLGRLATDIAIALRGRKRADWAPHLDNGDFVVVTNCEKIEVTGKKAQLKEYYTHSRYPGSLKTTPYNVLFAKDPRQVLFMAVEGMLPRTKHRKAAMRRLKLFVGSRHPHGDKNMISL